MASISVTISGLSKQLGDVGGTRDSIREVAKNLEGLLWQLATGTMSNCNPALNVGSSTSDAVAAWGTLTLSSGSGSVGGTIAGTAKTVTWATSDTASAAALAAAINADTTLQKIVVATSAGAVTTITALQPGLLGNQITLTASGTGMTAGHLASGKFTGGTGCDTQGPIGTL
ncbi:MAG TPA: hypothetical protein VFP65_19835 [Anaeromyxobacteraceae bacterium]|nr:hypothetical protein [Anaeromyxobacteraceae bacterium]